MTFFETYGKEIMKLMLFALLACLAGSVCAETTGNDLYRKLTSNDATENMQGFAYIEGVLDSEDWYLNADFLLVFDPKKDKQNKFKFPHLCFASDSGKITMGQLKDVIQKYIADHPEKRHFKGQVLIRFALLENFACANNPDVENMPLRRN